MRHGDLILLKRKMTKHASMYDSKPYIAVRVAGTQIIGAIEGDRDNPRDALRWKNSR